MLKKVFHKFSKQKIFIQQFKLDEFEKNPRTKAHFFIKVNE